MAAAVGCGPVPKLKDFVFIEKLGSGSYATVYKAYRTGGKREVVAVKCVAKTSLNKLSTENLLTEIELLKRLKHDHIVALKDFQWDQHYIYLIMEYCSGGDLSKYIKAQRTLPELAVKRFIQQLGLALQYMRSQNVSHMDLKPQNILLTSPSNPVLKVGDFGFAHYLIGDTEASMIRGSPLYMAPEIVIHRHYNEKADLWSTGVILYECLFGRTPFASKTLRELQVKIKDTKEMELPYGVHVSDRVRSLLHGLLQRDPDQRMSFEAFLQHPFVDLEHAPCTSSLNKAIQLSVTAVQMDSAGNAQKAISLYCQSLEHYVPAIHYESDQRRKEVLRKKVREFMDRAEQLKNQLKPDEQQKHQQHQEDEVEESADADPLDKLLKLSEDDQHLNAALKLIKIAQYKEIREDYDFALEKYELALGALLQLLKAEPKGRRRELLQKQVPQWMGRAERIKAYLDVRRENIEQLRELELQQEQDSKHLLMHRKRRPFMKNLPVWFNNRRAWDARVARSVNREVSNSLSHSLLARGILGRGNLLAEHEPSYPAAHTVSHPQSDAQFVEFGREGGSGWFTCAGVFSVPVTTTSKEREPYLPVWRSPGGQVRYQPGDGVSDWDDVSPVCLPGRDGAGPPCRSQTSPARPLRHGSAPPAGRANGRGDTRMAWD